MPRPGRAALLLFTLALRPLYAKRFRMAFSTQAKQLASKTKGPKGGNKPPIHFVEEAERLFTADEQGVLRSDVHCFSFYHFTRVADPQDAAAKIASALGDRALRDFGGTVYIAPEGLNAQFSVAVSELAGFEAGLREACGQVLDLEDKGREIDLNWGATLLAGSPAPFKRFRVIARPQILTDGLVDEETAPGGYDWNDNGEELDPAEWHEQLTAANSQGGSGGSGPVLLDCRNDYESDVGKFKGAHPLKTKVFSESWPALDAAVANLKSKDDPVYTYCTGGIRCVKVGAYLKQKHGLTAVKRLRHGIIGYERWAEQTVGTRGTEAEDDPDGVKSLFQGENFIFDQRPRPEPGTENK
mmetsp:Transcript_57980/g.131382  ORF Transcript_57980/g.131382 Transcript_57980/m.131382 type:complete len:356 (+) Transcript_57980:69-1136(+)